MSASHAAFQISPWQDGVHVVFFSFPFAPIRILAPLKALASADKNFLLFG